MTISRRQFLHTGLGVASSLACAQALPAIEPIVRQGGGKMQLSLAAYSYRDFLNLKNPTMTLEQFIDLGAEMKLDAIELTQYYFPKTDAAYLDSLKAHCTKAKLTVSGTAVGNNFCIVDKEKREQQVNLVKQWVEHTARLGGKTIRIFAGNVEKGDTEDKARERCLEAIQAACDHAAKHKVILALENHGGITATSAQLLALVKAVKHSAFAVNLDTGNFRTEDPYADLAKLAPYAAVVQVKTEIQRTGKEKEDADLKRIVAMLREISYQGYVVLEYEAKEDPKKAIPRHVEALRKLIS